MINREKNFELLLVTTIEVFEDGKKGIIVERTTNCIQTIVLKMK